MGARLSDQIPFNKKKLAIIGSDLRASFWKLKLLYFVCEKPKL
jgi:hypothetical protein